MHAVAFRSASSPVSESPLPPHLSGLHGTCLGLSNPPAHELVPERSVTAGPTAACI